MRTFLVLIVTLVIFNTQSSGYQPDYLSIRPDFLYFLRHKPFLHQMRPSLALRPLYRRPLETPPHFFQRTNSGTFQREEIADPNGRSQDMFYKVDNEPGYQTNLHGQPQPLFMPSKLYRPVRPLRELKNEVEDSLSTTMGLPAMIESSSESFNEDDANILTTTDITVSGLTEETYSYNDSKSEPISVFT